MDYTGCIDDCRKNKEACARKNCRYWISYQKDLNCSIISVEENGAMTLEEVSKRLDLTIVRIKQIQDEALNKMKKRILPVLHE